MRSWIRSCGYSRSARSAVFSSVMPTIPWLRSGR
jgi:hypothetical protein